MVTHPGKVGLLVPRSNCRPPFADPKVCLGSVAVTWTESDSKPRLPVAEAKQSSRTRAHIGPFTRRLPLRQGPQTYCSWGPNLGPAFAQTSAA